MISNLLLEASPAGVATDAGGQQPEGVLVTSERDRRVLDWLVCQVGREAVKEACYRLTGNRRAYVSNVAKALGLTPPTDLVLTPRDVARQNIAKCKAVINGVVEISPDGHLVKGI